MGAVSGRSVLGLVEMFDWVYIRDGTLSLNHRFVSETLVLSWLRLGLLSWKVNFQCEALSALDYFLFKSSISVPHAAFSQP